MSTLKDEILRSINEAPTAQEKIFRLCSGLDKIDTAPVDPSTTDRHRTIISLQVISDFLDSLGAARPALRIALLVEALVDTDDGVRREMFAPPPDCSPPERSAKHAARAAVAVGFDILAATGTPLSEIAANLDRHWPHLTKALVKPGKSLGKAASSWRYDLRKTQPKGSRFGVSTWAALHDADAVMAGDGHPPSVRAKALFEIAEKELGIFRL
jgi:hypothetical protein